MNQGGGHREVGHDHDITGVDGFKGVDIAFASLDQTDGGVVVGPSVGDGTFSGIDGGGELDGFRHRVVADHLIFRLIHDHVLDLQ